MRSCSEVPRTWFEALANRADGCAAVLGSVGRSAKLAFVLYLAIHLPVDVCLPLGAVDYDEGSSVAATVSKSATQRDPIINQTPGASTREPHTWKKLLRQARPQPDVQAVTVLVPCCKSSNDRPPENSSEDH